MAKISLRVYNREIEGMIEGGQLDEAVAHCQHILKTFSMHIETYRLLGKAFLEARRYADSADIFQRVLNAVPDDFVAHVGMSIIRDDEGKLDDAIWHMERAFQMQPSNAAIQAELRRLYSRRDGVEPPKIRLSRDALANMYAQGELFNQAIAEIRAILADDPNRPDLQVMLARSYVHAGHKVEAAEIAAQLLKKYPYCLDALRVLVEVLPGTARAEDTQVYRQRLRLLDPYASFVAGSVFESDKVADAAVNLERLEYKPGQSPLSGSSQPSWAASLGVKLEEEMPESAPPAWLEQGSAEPAAAPLEPVADRQAAQPEEDIPDFMREAGWTPMSGLASAEEGAAGEEPAPEEIARGEMPDWLKAMAPPEVAGGEQESEEDAADFKQIFSNLDSVQGADTFFEETAAPGEAPQAAPALGDTAEVRPAEEGEALAWLGGLAAGQAALADESPASAEEQAEEMPDWLKDIGAGGQAAGEELSAPEAEGESPFESSASPEPTKIKTQELPGLPSEPVREVAAASSEPALEAGAAKPLDIGDDTMAWLESLAAKQGAKAEELLTRPEDRSDALPDWLKDTVAEEVPPAAELPPAAEEAVAETAVPSEPEALPAQTRQFSDLEPESPPLAESVAAAPPAEGEVKPLEIGDDTFAWLESLAAKQGARPDELLTKPAERSEEMPDWLQQEAQAAQPAAAAPQEPAPVQQVEIPAEEVETPAPPTEELPAFIEQPVVQAETGGDDDISAWLKKLDETPATQEPAASLPEEAPPAAAEEEAYPSWLKDLEGEKAEPVPTDSSLPAWLREAAEAEQQPAPSVWEGEEAAGVEKPAPVTPSEWVPAEGGQEKISQPTRSASVEEVFAGMTPSAEPRLPKPTGALAPLPSQDKDVSSLSSGQQALEAGKLNDAMKEYGKLIKKGRLLDEVIHDLREAIYRFPVDIIIWQTLGDAYMRAGRLQDALDAYTKAEELLR